MKPTRLIITLTAGLIFLVFPSPAQAQISSFTQISFPAISQILGQLFLPTNVIEILSDVVFFSFVTLAVIWEIIILFHQEWRKKYTAANLAIFILIALVSLFLFALRPDFVKFLFVIAYVAIFTFNQTVLRKGH